MTWPVPLFQGWEARGIVVTLQHCVLLILPPVLVCRCHCLGRGYPAPTEPPSLLCVPVRIFHPGNNIPGCKTPPWGLHPGDVGGPSPSMDPSPSLDL